MTSLRASFLHLSPRLRRGLVLLLFAAAAIEAAASAWVAAVGPFELHLGPIPILGRGADKLLLVAVIAASAGIQLIEPLQPAARRAAIARTSALVAIGLSVISIVALVLPLLLPGFIIGHDGGVHQTYSYFFDRALHQGQFPVRWVEGITDGIGQPLFNFYQVGFYYLVALIHRCGVPLSLALKLAIAALWTIGPVFVYRFCRPYGLMPAVAGAVVFAWAPYVLLDAYVRTAYPEFAAIAFAPGVLWSCDRVLRTGRPGYVAALGLTTGVLLVSHLPAALIVAPVVAVWMFATALTTPDTRPRLPLAAAGAALGAGLSAFYVVPAIAELRLVQISRLTTDYFDFRHHFVPPSWWFDWSWAYGGSGADVPDHLSLQIGIAQWIVIAAAIGALAAVPWVSRERRRSIAGWLAIIGTAMLMTTDLSLPVWARVAPLSYVQFPWRFLLVPALGCAVLAATVLSAVRAPTTQAFTVICLVTFQWYITADYREMARERPRGTIAIDDPAWWSTDNARQWAFRESGYDPVSVTQTEGRQLPSGRWTLVAGDGEITAGTLADASLQLHTRASGPLTMTINSPFFDGWRITVDGAPTKPEVLAPTGYMKIEVPAGTHQVDARLERTTTRLLAEGVTLVSAAVWLALLLIPRRKSLQWWRT